MINLSEQPVVDRLSRLASAEHPLIWWSDPEAEFSELVAELPFAQGDAIDLGSLPG